MTTHRYDDDDVENHPQVVELRRALDVAHRALDMQAGTIRELHTGGDASTRKGDGLSLRRSIDQLLFLLVGMVIGALATFAGVSGRMSTTEAIVAAHTEAFRLNDQRWERFSSQMVDVGQKLAEISEQLKTRSRKD